MVIVGCAFGGCIRTVRYAAPWSFEQREQGNRFDATILDNQLAIYGLAWEMLEVYNH